MPDILHRIEIKSSPEKVYAAITEQEGLAGWWTRETKAVPAVNAVLEFRFGDHGFNRMKVLELNPVKRVRWQCVEGAKEWVGTELSFDLKEKNGSTIVLFAHRGWKEPVEFMHYCSTKWGVFMLSLKWLLEKGKGAPYPEDINIDL